MITFSQATLSELSIHRIGNKLQDEFYVLSDQSMHLEDEMLKQLLLQYFLSPYEKVNDLMKMLESVDCEYDFETATDCYINPSYKDFIELYWDLFKWDHKEKKFVAMKQFAIKYLNDLIQKITLLDNDFEEYILEITYLK